VSHPAGRVTAPDAELFAIRSAIVLATQQDDCERIVIFTDSMASAKRALDPTLHSGQGHSLAICRALQPWLEEDATCHVDFIQVPSKLKWKIHKEAHDISRAQNEPAGLRPATSLDSVRKAVTKTVQEDWKILFQDPNYRGHRFLPLKNLAGDLLQPTYLNEGTWLAEVKDSLIPMVARMCRCILNHAPIGAYYERFHIDEPHACECGHPLQTRTHLLQVCPRTVHRRDQYGRSPRLLLNLLNLLDDNDAMFAFKRPAGVG
jgi:hypothetical protein